MKALVRVSGDAAGTSLRREALRSRPCESFRQYFHGQIPTEAQKAGWIEATVGRMNALEFYQNDLYIVALERGVPFIRLTISRRDGQPFKTWKHLQEIKNQLVGPEHEAAELFPAESRLVDGVNEYHLWVHADPHYRFPFGYQTNRVVIHEPLLPLGSEARMAG